VPFRYDRGTLRSPRYTADGRARVDAYLTRSGVFEYLNPDGSTRREYRPPDEVFHADSLESLAQVPVTDDHPPAPLTSENATQYARGAVGETIRRDENKVASSIVVFDAGLIAKMRAGKVETSCGYHCDVDPTPGVSPEGERYDSIQRNIRYNHAAIVDVGRAGPDVRVRMDAAMQTERTDTGATMDPKELAAALVKVAEQTARADKLEAERDAEKARADKADQVLAAEKSRVDKAEADRDAAKSRADAADKRDADAARAALEQRAIAVLGEKRDFTGKSDRDVKIAVIEHTDSVKIATDKSDAYVDARFDRALEQRPQIFAPVVGTPAPRADADPEGAARAAMMKRNAEASQTKGSN
jgi:hypothetical protein